MALNRLNRYAQRQAAMLAKARQASPSPPQIEYTVTWEIQVYASTSKEAAEKALEIQRDPESIATVFDVTLPCTITHDLG